MGARLRIDGTHVQYYSIVGKITLPLFSLVHCLSNGRCGYGVLESYISKLVPWIVSNILGLGHDLVDEMVCG